MCNRLYSPAVGIAKEALIGHFSGLSRKMAMVFAPGPRLV
jgi:hypothetical protein